jgi:hypothetical protein
MGLLDDAIREHLELKRRRGADPDEVSRAENEALGPPGRPTPLEDAAANAAELDPGAAGPSAAPPYDAFSDEEWEPDEVPSDERLEAEAPTSLYERGTGETPAANGAPLDEAEDELYLEEDEELFADEEPGQAAEEESAPEAGAATVEPPAGAVRAPHEGELEQGAEVSPGEAQGEGEAEGEDVLEETPEFLQETPEHDRLWFEQKPPRDFDFGS